jgi:hypothetical protein
MSIFAKPCKQTITAKLSTEGELVGVSDEISNALWQREILKHLGYLVPPVRLLQDNTSTISLLNKGYSTSSRTRHISIRYFWLNERIDSGDVTVVHTRTNDLVADVLTKPLQGAQFRALRAMLLGNDENK